MPVLNDEGSRWTEICTVDGKTTYRIHRYRPRIEVARAAPGDLVPEGFQSHGSMSEPGQIMIALAPPVGVALADALRLKGNANDHHLIET